MVNWANTSFLSVLVKAQALALDTWLCILTLSLTSYDLGYLKFLSTRFIAYKCWQWWYLCCKCIVRINDPMYIKHNAKCSKSSKMRMRMTDIVSYFREITWQEADRGGWGLGAGGHVCGKQLPLSPSPVSKVMLSSHGHKSRVLNLVFFWCC